MTTTNTTATQSPERMKEIMKRKAELEATIRAAKAEMSQLSGEWMHFPQSQRSPWWPAD